MSVSAAPANLTGAMFVVAAMTMLGVADNFIRLVSDEITLWQFHVIRSVFAMALVLAVTRALGAPIAVISRRNVALRTGFLTGAMLIYFASLPMLPIAQVAAGLFTSPLWVLLISAAFLGERVGPRRIAAVAAGFLGTALTLDLFAAGFSARSLVPVAAGLLFGVSQIMTRRLCREESPWALLAANYAAFFAAGLAGAALIGWLAPDPGPAPFVLRGWGETGAATLALLLAFAASSVGSVWLLTRAYQIGEPTFLGLFDYTFLVAASLTAWAVWGEAIAPRGWAGMALILAAGVYLSLRGARVAARRPAPG